MANGTPGLLLDLFPGSGDSPLPDADFSASPQKLDFGRVGSRNIRDRIFIPRGRKAVAQMMPSDAIGRRLFT